jgi:hypothetical protein
MITKRTSVISTHTRVISTRIVRFPHAECDLHSHTSVILTRMSVIMTLTSMITTRSTVNHTCEISTRSMILTGMNVISSHLSVI